MTMRYVCLLTKRPKVTDAPFEPQPCRCEDAVKTRIRSGRMTRFEGVPGSLVGEELPP
jgi:hypothetical protein